MPSTTAPVSAEGGSGNHRARLSADLALRARLAGNGRAAYEAQFTETAVVRRYQDFFAAVTR